MGKIVYSNNSKFCRCCGKEFVDSTYNSNKLHCDKKCKEKWRYYNSKKRKEWLKRYSQCDKYKLNQQLYNKSKIGIERRKRFQKTEKYKISQKRYRQTEKHKNNLKVCLQGTKYKEWRKKYRQKENTKIKAREEAKIHRIKNPIKIKAISYAQKHHQRDSNCSWCNSNKNIHFHHTSYINKQGFSLCNICHRLLHKGMMVN